ncbi:PrgI family protein [Nocardia macrotermitis]|uniref:Uncharacterized protein n=1 Tax=Nocardia macrotermitis TaxID=2585198 RepID=A0A7K0DBN4_9NOCA|nr:PrgI family protein [Nocardia macrotermitis]MQY23029.1 hypothetical protein [Nocardia macrotermitis]
MTTPVRIHADVDQPDKLLGPFTFRQLVIVGATALGLYVIWAVTRAVVPPLMFFAGAVPIAALVTVAVLTRRDGLFADQLLGAAIAHRTRPRHLAAVPDGLDGRFAVAPRWATDRVLRGTRRAPVPAALSARALRLPREVTGASAGIGVVDLGADGLAVIATASTLNLALRSPAEQDSLVAALGGWLHTLRQPVQILIRSARLDLTAHLDRLHTAAHEMSPDLAAAAREHAEHLRELVTDEALTHRHVLLVWREPIPATSGRSPMATLAGLLPGRARPRGPASPAARRAAESRLLRRVSEATDLLAPLGVTVTALDPVQASAVLADCCDPSRLVPATADVAGPDAIITAHHPETIDTVLPTDPTDQTRFGPESLTIGTRHLEVGSEWVTTLAVTGYPREVGAGWLAPLLSHPGRVDVALHIDPVDPATAATRLRRQSARFESSRLHDARHHRPTDPAVEVAAEDAADLAARVARAEARLFRVGLYLTVHADSEADLADEVAAVRALAAGLLVDTCPVTYRQVHGWVTTLPLGLDLIGMHRTFDTGGLAAAVPFDSPQLPAPDPVEVTRPRGVLYGRDAAGGLMFVDRFAAGIDNHNMVVLGRSGAGKSFLVKTEILRSLYRGIEQIIIDPEDEYRRLADAVGGIRIPLGVPGWRLNPFDLDLHTSPEGRRTAPRDALTRRKLFLHTLIQAMLGEHTPARRAALDTALTATWTAAGITGDPATWTRPAPTLSDLREHLAASRTPAGDELAAALRPYTGEGSYAGLLDGPTTITPHGPLVVFSLREVPDELRTIATVLVLDATWRHISNPATRRPRMVTVDEAWLALRQHAGAEFLFQAAKRFRKYWAGLTLATQDCADVLSTDLGRAIMANAATQILLRQAPSAIDEVAGAFKLSDGEKQFLLSAAQGNGLVAVGGGTDRAVFGSLASPREYALITTDPSELTTTTDDYDSDTDIDLTALPRLTGPTTGNSDLDTEPDQDVFIDVQDTA